MTKDEAALLEVRLGYYDRTGNWDDEWGQLPPLLDDGGGVAIEVEEEVDDQAEPELRETGS